MTYNPPLILKLNAAISLLITLVGSIVLYLMAAENNIPVGNYVAFITSYGLITAAFLNLGQILGAVFSAQPLFEMARPIMTAEPENNSDKIKLESVSGNIELKDVSFRYEEDGPLILDNMSLTVKEGEYVAIVGQSGCGKSTLVRLLLGFEEPESGAILYDGL
ncbi:MAG: ATP-binding cassette domain-containing protein, partial [Candidatus Methanomethylophilaceae archaeon]|nr:ATP-binding cassette domain-containing protein [Candidatus Methanomethylophilaceae archaeon]